MRIEIVKKGNKTRLKREENLEVYSDSYRKREKLNP